MAAGDTKGDILRCLDRETRNLSLDHLNLFTTAHIASECHVSRNLASQYLNELVNDGLAIKVGGRPVLFLHRAGAERYFEVPLTQHEYTSLDELLAATNIVDYNDFDRAIGYDQSLSVCVERLKSAVRYPPNGLPALLIGAHGTGKELLANLAFEYGVNCGVLPAGAQFVKVDCSETAGAKTSIREAIFGDGTNPGAIHEAAGGIVLLTRVDHLADQDFQYVIARLLEDTQAAESHPARFILATSRSPKHELIAELARTIPIVAHIPRYVERTEDERIALVMHYLRVEGRRIASDVSISRGALRALVAADFEENLNGLQACITDCCANAYLTNGGDQLAIQTYNLPLWLLGTTTVQPDDDRLISCSKQTTSYTNNRILSFLQRLVDVYVSYQNNEASFDEFIASSLEAVHIFEDFRNFDTYETNPRVATYEHLLVPLMDELGAAYGIELSRKQAHSLAQLLVVQLWGGAAMVAWRKQNYKLLQQMAATIAQNSRIASSITEQLALRVKTALGIEFDALTLVLELIEIKEVVDESTEVRDAFGVILCHGYATATSIADAANRILNRRVFEAIDMTYDQEFQDVVSSLTRVLDRFSYVKTMAVLVDMGSLAQLADVLPTMANGTLYVINNVSTGLALEVGSALINHEDLAAVLDAAQAGLTPSWHAIEGARMPEAIIFCSEAGQDAADKIRHLVEDSLPRQVAMRFVTYDYHELARMGEQAPCFSNYRVRAVVGTMDPGVGQVPFISLESILYRGSSDVLDAALVRELDYDELASFHNRLLRNVTLRSVAESITILNPEMLYLEADRAMKRLSNLTGDTIDSRRQISLYVHLCGLIERLITHNFVESYPDVEHFEAEHQDFVAAFREAFDEMSRRYKVEIPVSEIAYVHHMLHTELADIPANASNQRLTLEDE